MDTKEPAANEVSQPEPAHDHQVAELRELWEQYGRSVITGVALAVILVLGLTVFRSFRHGKQEQAVAALGAATGIPDFERVLADYPKSPIAPMALLALARAQFEEKQYDQALATYDRFKAEHPGHDMVAAAETGRAQTLEAAGRIAEAEAAFRAFQAAHPADHYLHPAAAMGVGRCLEQLGQWDKARAWYEDFIAANPDSEWVDQAEVALRYVRRSMATAPAAP